ncbi:hypothetical protein KC357_g77 [Hortaea werneckii]|nr:hypothetical protein KC357_g77 [Hortaea werneckii]
MVLSTSRLSGLTGRSRLSFDWRGSTWAAKLLIYGHSMLRDTRDVEWDDDFNAEIAELVIGANSRHACRRFALGYPVEPEGPLLSWPWLSLLLRHLENLHPASHCLEIRQLRPVTAARTLVCLPPKLRLPGRVPAGDRSLGSLIMSAVVMLPPPLFHVLLFVRE